MYGEVLDGGHLGDIHLGYFNICGVLALIFLYPALSEETFQWIFHIGSRNGPWKGLFEGERE